MADDILIESRTSPVRVRNQAGEQEIILLLSVRPSDGLRAAVPRTGADAAAGADICLTLDVSGSMCGVIGDDFRRTGRTFTQDGQVFEAVEGGTSKLQACVAAARPLLGLLRPGDTLSLVTFGDDARVVCERLGRGQAAEYERALQGLSLQDKTVLGKGIETATAVLAGGPPGRAKKVLLMTDGNPTGEDFGVARRAAQAVADRGLTLDCLGFGSDFNFLFMQEIVTFSRGRSNLLGTQAEAEERFAGLLRHAQDTIATNLRLRLTFSDKVCVTDHYRGAPENLYLGKVRLPDAAREVVLSLGVLERDQRYDYYFRVTVPPQPGYTGEFRLFKAALTYDVPALGRTAQTVSRNITALFTGDAAQGDTRDSTVENGFTLAEIKRLERECEEARGRGDQEAALRCFRDIIKRYDNLGRAAERQEVQQALDEYVRTGNVPQELINKTARSSSQAAASGQIQNRLSDADRAAVMGGNRQRRAPRNRSGS
jgi:Ca-activated chloride channel family protein